MAHGCIPPRQKRRQDERLSAPKFHDPRLNSDYDRMQLSPIQTQDSIQAGGFALTIPEIEQSHRIANLVRVIVGSDDYGVIREWLRERVSK